MIEPKRIEETKAPLRSELSLSLPQALDAPGSRPSLPLAIILLIGGVFQRGDGSKKVVENAESAEDVSKLPKQKWLARCRDPAGKFRHIETYDHEPTAAELEVHGSGHYNILTTKPFLRRCKNVEIPEKSKSLQKQPPSTTPPTHAEVSLQSTTIDSIIVPRSTSLKQEIAKPSTTVNRVMPQEPVRRIKPSSILPPQTKVVEEVDRGQHSLKPTPPRDVKVPKPKPVGLCARCLTPASTLVRCGFCREIFCSDYQKNCFDQHDCPNSRLCYECNRRVQADLVEIADLCHHHFCSIKCLNECRRINMNEPGCKKCGVETTHKDIKKVKVEEGEDGMVGKIKDIEMENELEEMGDENGEQEEEEIEETCEGVPKSEACPECQKQNCQGRWCDGDCCDCNFEECPNRCENDGECKFCSEYDDCMIRCTEAPERCDNKHCRGFECEDRMLSGEDCDDDCRNCDDTGCYFWEGPEEEDNGNDNETE